MVGARVQLVQQLAERLDGMVQAPDQQALGRQSQPTLHKQSEDSSPSQSRDRGQLDAADGLKLAVSAQTAPAHKTNVRHQATDTQTNLMQQVAEG